MAISTDSDDPAESIRATLGAVKWLRAEVRADPQRADDRLRVRAWQAERLASTYPDLLESDRYRPAAEFFLSDLYGPKDFSHRDDEVGRILPTMARLLPEAAMRTFAAAIELDCLSEELDADVVAALRVGQPAGRLDVTGERYAAAYRRCGRHEDRVRQIAIVDRIGVALDRLSRMRLVAAAIELMGGPAKLAGLGELHDFFHRGYSSFRRMGGAREFLETIHTRETRLMEALFAGTNNPDVEAGTAVAATRLPG